MVVADPDILKQIMLKEFSNFRNRGNIAPELTLLHPLNLNILAARDENWKKIRSTLTPTFSTAKLKQLTELMEESTDTLEDKVKEVADTGKELSPRFKKLIKFFSFVNRKLPKNQKYVGPKLYNKRVSGVTFALADSPAQLPPKRTCDKEN